MLQLMVAQRQPCTYGNVDVDLEHEAADLQTGVWQSGANTTARPIEAAT